MNNTAIEQILGTLQTKRDQLLEERTRLGGIGIPQFEQYLCIIRAIKELQTLLSINTAMETPEQCVQVQQVQPLPVIYRIYTEDRANLGSLVSRRFSTFTITPGIRYEKGVAKSSAVIEIVGAPADKSQINILRDDILLHNNRHTALVMIMTTKEN